MHVCACMTACVIFIHVEKDLRCELLFIILECDIIAATFGGGEGR